MATPTSKSAGSGPRKSPAVKSTATAAAGSSSRARPGTSATTTSTAPSTGVPSTKSATGRPRSTNQKEKAPKSAATPATGSRKKATPKALAAELDFDLYAAGGRVISIFGAFNSRVMVEIPAKIAPQLFANALVMSSPTALVEAVERDLAAIAKESEDLSRSALAAAAMAMALEIENPYNSATSKSMCAKSLLDALDRIRELIPAEAGDDALDELARKRAARIAGHPAS